MKSLALLILPPTSSTRNSLTLVKPSPASTTGLSSGEFTFSDVPEPPPPHATNNKEIETVNTFNLILKFFPKNKSNKHMFYIIFKYFMRLYLLIYPSNRMDKIKPSGQFFIKCLTELYILF